MCGITPTSIVCVPDALGYGSGSGLVDEITIPS